MRERENEEQTLGTVITPRSTLRGGTTGGEIFGQHTHCTQTI